MASVPVDPVPPAGLLRLVRTHAVDAPLGGLLWLLREGGVPALVVGPVGDESVALVANALEEVAQSDSSEGTRAKPTVRTLRAGSLQEAFGILSADPFNLAEDALRSLGMVLVVRDGRVTAAHYLRPVERDGEGHLQRRPPAVLATWEERDGWFEHFSWAVTPELAMRVNRTQANLEEEIAKRARLLAGAGD